jgi:hypothetical protein
MGARENVYMCQYACPISGGFADKTPEDDAFRYIGSQVHVILCKQIENRPSLNRNYISNYMNKSLQFFHHQTGDISNIRNFLIY